MGDGDAISVLKTVPKSLENRQWKLEIRSHRPQNCYDWLKYLEESGRANEICAHSDICEKPPVKVGEKLLRLVTALTTKRQTE